VAAAFQLPSAWLVQLMTLSMMTLFVETAERLPAASTE